MKTIDYRVPSSLILPTSIDSTKIAPGAVIESKLAPVASFDINPARVGRYRYHWATQGGVVGSIPLIGNPLPAKAVVFGGLIIVTIAPTSGGAATAGITLEGAGDTVAPALVSGPPWSTLGIKAIIPAWSAATTITTTIARTPNIVIAVANLTAGDFDLILFYNVSD